jgi:hypothetical protein
VSPIASFLQGVDGTGPLAYVSALVAIPPRQARNPCPDGGIGRRTSFRCWRLQDRGGSSPLLGTIHFLTSRFCVTIRFGALT